MLSFIRIGCAVPAVRVADTKHNTEDICNYIIQADAQNCDILVFPELSITGYTCGDLFFQKTLLDGAREGLCRITACSAQHPRLTVVVGLPLTLDGQLYNCAAVVAAGEIRGIIPKTYLPNYGEFGEWRWFTPGAELRRDHIECRELGIDAWYAIPVGTHQVFCLAEGAMMGVEICEDLFAPVPPSSMLALQGAEVIVNLVASPELAGKRRYRREKVIWQSETCKCIYALCASGATESTQDLVFSGHSVIAQRGELLGDNEIPLASGYLMIRDADLDTIRAERRWNTSFRDAAAAWGTQAPVRPSEYLQQALRADGSLYPVKKQPFVGNPDMLLETFQIQVTALTQRLKLLNAQAVLGVSGGLDSALALLVAVEAMRQLGRPASCVHAVTMPGFGTSCQTYDNARMLIKLLGATEKEIPIRNAVLQHFQDIGHDPSVHNATYENAQARERTQILMDYAGIVGGIVVGTGDMSELALGWCTYNGDHMSMYGVNASVPKTMIPGILQAVATMPEYSAAQSVLKKIIATPISPELLPPDEEGNIAQQTEDLVGPYALHDFFLFHMLRDGIGPQKLYHLACGAFADEFDGQTVKKWLQVFCRRFFAQQFKRSCMPEGPKTGLVSLNPRGDWHMPSDASARLWLEEAESL